MTTTDRVRVRVPVQRLPSNEKPNMRVTIPYRQYDGYKRRTKANTTFIARAVLFGVRVCCGKCRIALHVGCVSECVHVFKRSAITRHRTSNQCKQTPTHTREHLHTHSAHTQHTKHSHSHSHAHTCAHTHTRLYTHPHIPPPLYNNLRVPFVRSPSAALRRCVVRGLRCCISGAH